MTDRKYKVMAVFGTRPEAIKMAPVVKAFRKMEAVDCKVVVTAQHREMLDQVLSLFEIVPDYDLNLMQHGQSLAALTSRILEGMDSLIEKIRPHFVLVQGDTTTTFASALAAFYHKIPIGHVEAGLRTGEKYFPWPEEINRRLAGSLADLHFAPTQIARKNLLREGVPDDRIFVTGNTVIDALLATVKKDYRFLDHKLPKILADNRDRRLILVTTHRRENWGDPMVQIYRALITVLDNYTDTYVIFPMHKNPTVRNAVSDVLGKHPRVFLIEPLDYEPFINLMAHTYIILSDSGGIQEEAPSLGKPVLVVRDTTERPEAVAAGTAKIIGTNYDNILRGISELLSDQNTYKQMCHASNPYGDGTSGTKIAEIVVKKLNKWYD